MPCIETSDRPLVFKARKGSFAAEESAASERGDDKEEAGRIRIRVEVRALEGMQKEAIVYQVNPSGSAWRLVSDEGPYLNGTDLAPFPLAFFTAGLQFCFMTQLLRHAKERNVELKSLAVSQDNRYTMTGSILRGDMTGGAMPVDVRVKIDSDAPKEVIAKLIRMAEESSPGHALMRDVLANAFSLNLNGRDLPVTNVRQSEASDVIDPLPAFEAIEPDEESSFLPEIITKISTAEKVYGVEGGVASSLQPEQKRTLHIRGEARVIKGMLMETVIKLFSPLGSNFRFLSDSAVIDGGRDTAPPALAYLSAGIGFCYMTQLGRYSHITKQKIKSARIVQNNLFTAKISGQAPAAKAAPVNTHVFVEADEPDDEAKKLVSMSEQTCFLHAAMRDSYPSNISAELNDDALPLSDNAEQAG